MERSATLFPAAIGAELACPQQPVISICGDGGFLFTMQELATASALNLDLIVLVFNDNASARSANIRIACSAAATSAPRSRIPDFVKLGDSFGAKCVRIEPKDLGAAVGARTKPEDCG